VAGQLEALVALVHLDHLAFQRTQAVDGRAHEVVDHRAAGAGLADLLPGEAQLGGEGGAGDGGGSTIAGHVDDALSVAAG